MIILVSEAIDKKVYESMQTKKQFNARSKVCRKQKIYNVSS
jgi:hypothetical protein